MAQQTYRQLVNKAIMEAGVTLSDISTGASFTTPADTMHKRFKTWVADAWKEIQMEFSEQEFTIKQASILVNPRVYIEQASGTSTPLAGQLLKGEDTLTSYAIAPKIDGSTADIHLLSGVWGSSTAKAYIGLDFTVNVSFYTPGQFYKLNEWLDFYDSDDVLLQNKMARVKGPGRYVLETEVSDLLDPRLDTFYLQTPGGFSGTGFTNNNDATNTQTRLRYVPWDQWNFAVMERTIGWPEYFTQAPNGHIEFNKILDQPYILNFHYEAEPQVLSTETEVISNSFKEQYEDMIVWRAVMHYADYDNKPNKYMLAKKRYEYYLKLILKKEMPTVSFSPTIFRQANFNV